MEDNTYTFRLGGATITLRERTWGRHTTSREYFAAPRLYVDVDDSLIDNLANRTRRPYNDYKTIIWGSMLDQVFDLGKLQWSQYAGCSCPCSPGFILPKQDVNIGGKTWSRFDAWVEFKDIGHVDERKAPRLVLA
jgi:hypothetical protein